MKKWRMIIDVEKCENCNNCFLACKDEHCGNDWTGYSLAQPHHGHRWMNILRRERGCFPHIDVAYLPKPCMHCDDAPCVRGAENKAIYKRKDGIVIIDPKKAKGQKALVQSCPYGAIWWNEEHNIPQKCTLCAHLLDQGWKAPRCVQACPTGALSIVHLEDSDMQSLVETQDLEVLGPKNNPTRPGVFYKNLYRFKNCFIAGSVATGQGSTEECVADAAVKLIKDGKMVRQTVTDAFGDFKFDNLAKRSGIYRIEVESHGSPVLNIEIDLGESQSLGILWI